MAVYGYLHNDHATRLLCEDFLVLEEVLYLLVTNHLLIKDVSTRFGTLYHLNDLCVGTPVGFTLLKRCDCFLCHGLSFVNKVI